MEKRWILKDADSDKVLSLKEELRIHPVLCRLLVQRGIYTFDEAKHFFRPSLDHLHDPFLMKDMYKATHRIAEAIARHERILIYGDYDVDGTTAVALVYLFFKDIYSNIDFYIPNRYLEGYGISFRGVDYAKQNNCTLMIALDCGIKANDKADYAASLGVDLIICDHHLPGSEIPNAYAVLDPHQPGCNYPYKELSGCGIGFKLIQAFAKEHDIPFEKVYTLLDLVVISIASDIVPITGENRVLSYFGLVVLNENPRAGLKALTKVSGFEAPLNISNIVFGLGPRINAAGRMDDASKAVQMLISDTQEHAKNGANILQERNIDRKEVDKKITSDALFMLENDGETPQLVTNVLFNDAWHKGVIGIVASRVLDHYYKPTILLTQSNGLIFGSARSIKGFDIYEAIKQCSDLLEQYGGHMFAAGLSLLPENLEKFKKRFDDVVRASILPEQLKPQIEIDAEICLKDIKPAFYNIVKQFAPFGPGNMQPVFLAKNLCDNGRSKIVGDNHLKMGLKDEHLFIAYAIAFQKGVMHNDICKGNKFDVCFTVEENIYNDTTSLQLNIKEIKLN